MERKQDHKTREAGYQKLPELYPIMVFVMHVLQSRLPISTGRQQMGCGAAQCRSQGSNQSPDVTYIPLLFTSWQLQADHFLPMVSWPRWGNLWTREQYNLSPCRYAWDYGALLPWQGLSATVVSWMKSKSGHVLLWPLREGGIQHGQDRAIILSNTVRKKKRKTQKHLAMSSWTTQSAWSKAKEKGKMENVRLKINQVILA